MMRFAPHFHQHHGTGDGSTVSTWHDTSRFGTFAPRSCLVAIIDRRDEAQQALLDVEREGFSENDVRIVSASAAVTHSWALARHPGHRVQHAFSTLVRTLCSECDEQRAYIEAARHGGCLVEVHARSREEIERASRVLIAHAGHDLAYYGAHGSVEMLGV